VKNDILGNPIPPPPKPPYNGICPDCGGIIKSDVVAGWMFYDCDREFDENESLHISRDK